MPLNRFHGRLAFRPGHPLDIDKKPVAKAESFQAWIQGHKCPCSLLSFKHMQRQSLFSLTGYNAGMDSCVRQAGQSA